MIQETEYDHPPLTIHPNVLQTLIDIFKSPTPVPTDTIERIMYNAGRQSVLDYLIQENKNNNVHQQRQQT